MKGVQVDRWIDGCGGKHSTIKTRGGGVSSVDIQGRRRDTRLYLCDEKGLCVSVGGEKTLRAIANEILFALGDREEPS